MASADPAPSQDKSESHVNGNGIKAEPFER